MLWVFRKIADRLTVQLAMLLAARMESHAALLWSESREELLRRAATLEGETLPGGKELASELRQRAAKMNQANYLAGAEAAEVVAGLREESFAEEIVTAKVTMALGNESPPLALPAVGKNISKGARVVKE